MKPSSCKQKGRKLQQDICAAISEITGLPWGPDMPIESRPMGMSGTDVRLDANAQELFKYSTEAKNQQVWAIHEWIKQAKNNCKEGTDWLLVCKRNHSTPVVVLDFKVFMSIIKENLDLKNKV